MIILMNNKQNYFWEMKETEISTTNLLIQRIELFDIHLIINKSLMWLLTN